jgi:hypothetical protein
MISVTLLHEELATSVHALRGALTDLIQSVGGDPLRPQEFARRFGVDKSLAWKVSRVIRAADPEEALPLMPGEAAFDILLKAMQKAGAPGAKLDRARGGVRTFTDAVERHVGDRPTLEIVLDAMPSSAKDRLALSRKLAFRGNSGIWGVQARVRVNTMLLCPNPEEPSMVDAVLVGGWVDFRRMRADARWTLFRVRSFRGDETVDGDMGLDPDEPRDGPMLLRRFCSDNMPGVHAVPLGEPGGMAYELGPGPVGNSGMFSCFFGSVSHRLGSRFASHPQERAEFMATVSAPAEVLLFDLIAHQSLELARNPHFEVYGQLTVLPSVLNERDRLPIVPETQDLGRCPPELATPLVDGYADLIEHAFRRTNWDANQFIGTRFTLDYPPFPSTVLVGCPLEGRT